MIAVIVPAHNEAGHLEPCLMALRLAALRAQEVLSESVRILVVLDRCTDASPIIACQHQVETVEISARNVGVARATGAALMLEQGARWLAFTDADSRVPSDWLLCQLKFSADAVCGTVHIKEWEAHQDEALRGRYEGHYRMCEDHGHIHGANLGISATAYQRAGGFQPFALNEDVQIVKDLQRAGARIVWTARNSVCTSSRSDCRVRGGFGDFLSGL